MPRRQTSPPSAWFIVDRPLDADMRRVLRRLPRGAGVIVLRGNDSWEVGRLASARTVVHEKKRGAARVHNLPELRRALIARTPLILLSPIYPTATHPEWPPIPLMRAAALARLAGRRLVALGGMNARRFTRISRLGFQGWAGISAFRT